MPSDSNGNYSLPAGYLANTGGTIVVSQHNPPLEDIASALTARLMRSGAGGMTGPLKAADGTVTEPGITFGTATNSGFYKTASGWGFSISGTLVAEFGAGGLLSGVPTAAINDQAVTYPKIVAPSATKRLLGSNGNAALAITGAANNGSGLIRLAVADSSSFTTGQKKIVAGVAGTTEANGRWTITVVDATHIDLQGSAFANAYTTGGTIGGGVDEIQLGAGLTMTGDTLAANVSAASVPNYLSGLTLSTAGSSATFGIAAGGSNDSTNADLMALATAYTKTTSAWAVGTGNGALDTGTIAPSTWYHVYQIKRPDTGVVDYCISTSASAPTFGGNIPAAYTRYRRIGSMLTTGASQWTKFTQTVDRFILDTSVNNVTGAALTTARASQALSVPTGVVVEALFRANLNSAGAGATICVLFTSLQESDQAAVVNGLLDLEVGVGDFSGGSFARLTNTSAQIGIRGSAAAGSLVVATYGWIDFRGK